MLPSFRSTRLEPFAFFVLGTGQNRLSIHFFFNPTSFHFAIDLMADDEEALRQYCLTWDKYPRELIRNRDRPAVVDLISRYFGEYFHDYLPREDKASPHLINRRPYVKIRDYGRLDSTSKISK